MLGRDTEPWARAFTTFRLSHVNFVSLDRSSRQQAHPADSNRLFGGTEIRFDVQKAKTLHYRRIGFHLILIDDVAPQHLKAATDADDQNVLFSHGPQITREPRIPQERQVLYGAFRSR